MEPPALITCTCAERIGTIGPLVDASMGVEAVGAFLRSESARWREIERR